MWGGMKNSVEKVSIWDWGVGLAVESLHCSSRGPDAAPTVHIKWLSLLITPVPVGLVLSLASGRFLGACIEHHLTQANACANK